MNLHWNVHAQSHRPSDSEINPVSQLDWSAHISPQWVGTAIAWLATDAGREYDGTDFSLKTQEGLRAVGLISEQGLPK